MRNCVQIGLNHSAEWMWLANHAFERLECLGPLQSGHAPELPFGVEQNGEGGDWYYYGIDLDPDAIVYLTKKFPYHDRVRWACVKIIPQGFALADGDIYFSGTYGQKQACYMGGISLSEFLRGMDINEVEFLAMDIEGHEYELFEHYDWHVKPRIMRIDGHHVNIGLDRSPDHLREFIIPQGYAETDLVWSGEPETATNYHIDFILKEN